MSSPASRRRKGEGEEVEAEEEEESCVCWRGCVSMVYVCVLLRVDGAVDRSVGVLVSHL
jgi:hypothetical protein